MPIQEDNGDLAAASKPKPKAEKKLSTQLFANKVGTSERMLFTEQLSLLLDTGMNLHASMQAIHQQIENPVFKAAIGQIMDDISQGLSFSGALAKHQKIFPPTFISLIGAAEIGGFIPTVLKQLYAMDEHKERLRGILFNAISYPMFLIFFSVAVTIFVLVFVFPKFAELFKSIEDQLPWTTVVLLALSFIFQNYWYYLLAAIAGICTGIYFWYKKFGHEFVDNLKISIPGIRDVFLKIYFIQVFQVMSISLRNGVTVVDTLNSCQTVVSNSRFRAFIIQLKATVEEGANVSEGFNQCEFVPNLVKQMITTGDQIGNLPVVMEKLGEYFEKEISRRLATLSRFAEPIMLLFMGCVVGLLVSSLILPIFKLSRVVH